MVKRAFLFLAVLLVVVLGAKGYNFSTNEIKVYGQKSSGDFKTDNYLISKSCGSFYSVEGDFDLNIFLKSYKAEVVEAEKIGDIVNYYCFTNRLSGREIINGKAVNLHVAVSTNSVTVGTPIIYGGY